MKSDDEYKRGMDMEKIEEEKNYHGIETLKKYSDILMKSSVFVDHIKSHLNCEPKRTFDSNVVCKICNDDIDTIFNRFEALPMGEKMDVIDRMMRGINE